MKKSLLYLFALAACADPQPVFTPVTVDVPVAMPCHIAPVTEPDYALAHVAAADSIFVKARAALIEIEQRKAIIIALQNQNQLCP